MSLILPTEDDARKLSDVAKRVLGMKGGPGIRLSNTPAGITVSLEPTKQYRPQSGSSQELFDAIITVATAINGGVRYKYTMRFGHWDMTSSPSTGGAWVDDSGGTDSYAFNSTEDMNTFTSGTGAIGTGNTNVKQSDGTIGTTTCKLLPIPVGGYVVVKKRGTDMTATPPQDYYTIVNFANSAQ